MNVNLILYLLVALMLGASPFLGRELYRSFMTNLDKTTLNKVKGLVLAGLSIGAVGATSAATMTGLGPTTYVVPSSGGIIIQGSAYFKVSWDPYALNETTSLDWGTIEVGTKYTRTVYITNTGTAPLDLTVSLANWNWVTEDPANEVLFNALFGETTSLAPGRFRALIFEMTLLKPIYDGEANRLNFFSYDIILTGSNPGTTS